MEVTLLLGVLSYGKVHGIYLKKIRYLVLDLEDLLIIFQEHLDLFMDKMLWMFIIVHYSYCVKMEF